MDISPGTRESSRWRFLITPKWLGWHVFVIFSFLVMLWLGNWQLHRAEAGNELRITPSLYPLWDKVIETSLDFSGIRLRNAVRP